MQRECVEEKRKSLLWAQCGQEIIKAKKKKKTELENEM